MMDITIDFDFTNLHQRHRRRLGQRQLHHALPSRRERQHSEHETQSKLIKTFMKLRQHCMNIFFLPSVLNLDEPSLVEPRRGELIMVLMKKIMMQQKKIRWACFAILPQLWPWPTRQRLPRAAWLLQVTLDPHCDYQLNRDEVPLLAPDCLHEATFPICQSHLVQNLVCHSLMLKLMAVSEL